MSAPFIYPVIMFNDLSTDLHLGDTQSEFLNIIVYHVVATFIIFSLFAVSMYNSKLNNPSVIIIKTIRSGNSLNVDEKSNILQITFRFVCRTLDYL